MNTFNVYLETGMKRTFAGAVDWPGWCRSGRDEPSALAALVESGPRYAGAMSEAKIAFKAPDNQSALVVVERLPGTGSTDFGAPDAIPSTDLLPINADELNRLTAILQACWQEFDMILQSAQGRTLRKGPRGGGRDVPDVVRHVLNAENAYLGRLGRGLQIDEFGDLSAEMARLREAVLERLTAGQRGELPERGPRGGKIWPLRYFVRRSAWHVLDHAWEIEDKIEG